MSAVNHRPPAKLNAGAVTAVAREIRLQRYMAHSVSDEELVRKIIESYRERTRRAPRAPRRP